MNDDILFEHSFIPNFHEYFFQNSFAGAIWWSIWWMSSYFISCEVAETANVWKKPISKSKWSLKIAYVPLLFDSMAMLFQSIADIFGWNSVITYAIFVSIVVVVAWKKHIFQTKLNTENA